MSACQADGIEFLYDLEEGYYYPHYDDAIRARQILERLANLLGFASEMEYLKVLSLEREKIWERLSK